MAQQLTEFRYFLDLPPETRNQIYEVVLVNDHPISITSVRNKRKKNDPSRLSPFGRLLRVNKQINSEAKSVFYSLNTFVVGNGWWGSRKEENLQALKAFIARVPKDCIARIKHILIVLFLKVSSWDLRWSPVAIPVECMVDKNHTADLKDVGRAISKHFVGIERVTVRAETVDQNIMPTLHKLPDDRIGFITGDVENLAKIVRGLLDALALRGLKEVHWMQSEGLKLHEFAEKVKHEKLEERVKLKFVEWDVWRPGEGQST
ncbi:uncharacterized protein PAC_16531 [Phialocephala subalpina]|uniref:F-box domain-containing protein n=1 Tax=Phialocephala subalpina TaxID=576137 RepID=A0A1L7XNJ2_9HELO|nr:uncharacterized protein PAC_16531 [Phialocephala subalpina]